MCHAPLGIINYGLALATCLYLAPYMVLVRPMGEGEKWCTMFAHHVLFFLFSAHRPIWFFGCRALRNWFLSFIGFTSWFCLP